MMQGSIFIAWISKKYSYKLYFRSATIPKIIIFGIVIYLIRLFMMLSVQISAFLLSILTNPLRNYYPVIKI